MDGMTGGLRIEDLQVEIRQGNERLYPVDGLELSVPKGSVVGLVGESGCGKSMTAKAVMGLLGRNIRVSRGQILFDGQELTALSQKEMRRRTGRDVSMIFQEPMTSLNPTMRVGKQVEEVLLLHTDLPRAERKRRVIEMFRSVGIPEPERRYHAYPHQLSGGLRQRVVIAMAMILDPPLLIADEPTTALDVTIERQILQLMARLRRDHDTSILMITHNLGVVSEFCDFVYVMYLGEIVESAPVETIFSEAAHPYTMGLLDCVPRVDDPAGRTLTGMEGTVPSLNAVPAGCRLCGRCRYETERCRREHPRMTEVSSGHFVRCVRAIEGQSDD